jgi:hypothetical protein
MFSIAKNLVSASNQSALMGKKCIDARISQVTGSGFMAAVELWRQEHRKYPRARLNTAEFPVLLETRQAIHV